MIYTAFRIAWLYATAKLRCPNFIFSFLFCLMLHLMYRIPSDTSLTLNAHVCKALASFQLHKYTSMSNIHTQAKVVSVHLR